MMRIFLRIALFLFSLEIFLRIGGLVSVSLQNYESRSNLTDKNAYRIMCIGESTTYAGGKDSYPSQLERILNEQNKGKVFEVINRGIPGSNSADIVAALSKEIELYKPNMVIAMVGINDDLHTVIYRDSLSDKVKTYIGDIRVWRVWKFLWAHVKTEMSNLFGEKDLAQLSVQDKLKREIRVHPKGSGAYIELGQYLVEEKAYSEAEKLFKRALKINPKKEWGYEQLAQVYTLEGNLQEAEGVYTRSLVKNSEQVWAYASLSRFYKGLHREKQAQDVLIEGVTKNPGQWGMYVELGSFYCKEGQFVFAQNTFKQAMQIDPKNWGIYAELGYCYGQQGRYEDMETMFDKAVSLNSSDVFLDLSDWYLKHHEALRAEALLKRALVNYPDQGRIIRGLATIYLQMGQKELAFEYQRKAQELDKQKPLEATVENYRKIVQIVQAQGISMVAISYANRDAYPLKQMLNGFKGITFVDNGNVFKEALQRGQYDDYFTDAFAGDFGHCTSQGAHLLAENVAKNIMGHF